LYIILNKVNEVDEVKFYRGIDSYSFVQEMICFCGTL